MLSEIFKQIRNLKRIDVSKKPQSKFEKGFSKALAVILFLLMVLMSWYIVTSEYAKGFTKIRLFILIPVIISVIVVFWKGISLKWIAQWIKKYWILALVVFLIFAAIAGIFIDLFVFKGTASMLIAALVMLILGIPTFLYSIKAIKEIKHPKLLAEAGKETKNKTSALLLHYFYFFFGIAITIGGILSLISYYDEYIYEGSGSIFSTTHEYEGESTEPYGYIDTSGTVIIPFKYDDARSFHEGLAAVYIDYYWGYINAKDSLVIKANYNTAGNFHEGIAYVGEYVYGEYTYGYINKQQDTIIPFQYKRVSECSEGLVAIFDTSWKYFDTLGNLIIDAGEYDDIGLFKEGMAYVQKDDKYGFINKKGELIIELQYDYAASFSEGIACVGKEMENDLRYSFIDKNGDIVIDFILYNKPGEFHEGKATYGYKFIDKNGETVSTNNAYVEQFSNGLAKFRGYMDEEKTKSGYGYLDTACNIIIPSKYNDAHEFSCEYAPVQPESGSLWGYIDRNDNWLVKPEFMEAEAFSEGLAKVRKKIPNNPTAE